MTAKWSDVIAKPEYQALPDDQKAEAQNQYFNSVVAPKVAAPSLDEAKSQFFSAYPAPKPAQPISQQPQSLAGANPPAGAQSQRTQQKPGILDRIGNFFTGADRETRATRDLPELQNSGLLSGIGIDPIKAAQISATLATTLDPQEAGKILSAASPDIGIQQDEKGNWLAANNKTGARAVINKPGVSGMDALQLAATGALYSPAGGAATKLGVTGLKGAAALGGAAALTETGIQGAQAAAGGTFDSSDVAYSAAGGVAGDLVARGIGAMGNAARTSLAGQQAQAASLRSSFDSAVAAGEDPATAAARLLGQPAPTPTREGTASAVANAATASKRQQIPTIDSLASEVAPSQPILSAAERLGVRDQLIPSQYSSSQAYREIEQGLASIPGSQLNVQQKEAYAALAQQADNLITGYGGTVDKSGLSDRFKQHGLNTIEALGKQSDDLYTQVSAAIPATTKTAPTSTINYLNAKIADLGDRTLLSPAERRTIGSLTRTDEAGNPVAPNYAALDYLRKQVGSGLRNAGPFKDAESGSLKQLYAALSDDQQRTAEAAGVGQLFSIAKSLVAQRKQVEDGLHQVIGKDLKGALASALGGSLKQLGTGNFKDFDRIIAQVPANMRQEAVLTSLNDVFTAGSRAEKQLSAPGFVDWYSSLQRNDAARQRLQKYLPIGASQQLDDIATVAKGMRDASRERITTGRISSLLENFANEGGMLGKLWDVGRKAAAAEGVTSSIGIPGAGTVGVLASTLSKQKTPIAQAAGDLLASQRFKDAVNATARSGGTAAANVKAREKQLMRTAVYKKWVSALSNESAARVALVGPLAYLANSSGSDDR